jgi:hypothetical protein
MFIFIEKFGSAWHYPVYISFKLANSNSQWVLQMRVDYSSPCFGFNIRHPWKKCSHKYVIPKRETIFVACEWIAGKVFVSVYLGYKSKSSTLLYFSFLAKVALPISYFHLRNARHIVDSYNERNRKQTHWFFFCFEICDPVTDFNPYISNCWSLFHTVRGHVFWQD